MVGDCDTLSVRDQWVLPGFRGEGVVMTGRRNNTLTYLSLAVWRKAVDPVVGEAGRRRVRRDRMREGGTLPL